MTTTTVLAATVNAFPDALLKGFGVGLAICLGIGALCLGAAFVRRLAS